MCTDYERGGGVRDGSGLFFVLTGGIRILDPEIQSPGGAWTIEALPFGPGHLVYIYNNI